MSMAGQTLSTAIPLALGGILMVAALRKLRSISAFELALTNLLPRSIWRGALSSRSLARTVTGAEITLGAGLLTLGAGLLPRADSLAVALGISAVGVFTVFGAVTLVAVRRRVPCGCGGANGQAATAADLARSGTLVLLAVSGLVLTLAEPRLSPSGELAPHELAAAAGLFLAVVAPSLVVRAARSRPALAAAKQAASAAASRTDDGDTRRGFLQKAGVGLLAVIGIAAGLPTTAFAEYQYLTCGERADRCSGCCEGDPTCKGCCYGFCFTYCELRTNECDPLVSCDGCWPPSKILVN